MSHKLLAKAESLWLIDDHDKNVPSLPRSDSAFLCVLIDEAAGGSGKRLFSALRGAGKLLSPR
jgi:hypothetical protein